MKAFGLTIVAVIALFGVGLLVQSLDLNRLGADQYYVQVGDGLKTEEHSSSGKKYVIYQYSLDGFDQDGKEKRVAFTANKELRKDAYLRVYLKGDTASSYEEVQPQELPEPVKRKLYAG